jgi:hypothetical protein
MHAGITPTVTAFLRMRGTMVSFVRFLATTRAYHASRTAELPLGSAIPPVEMARRLLIQEMWRRCGGGTDVPP